jgi:hypothetical protein
VTQQDLLSQSLVDFNIGEVIIEQGNSRKILTEFTNFEAMAWEDLRVTKASSAPLITNTGMASTAFSNDSAFCGERTVSDDSLPISWSAVSQPSTHRGAWLHKKQLSNYG